MILSNIEIHKAIDEGRISIEPEPLPRTPMMDSSAKCPYDTTAVDLRLGVALSIPKGGAYSFDFKSPGEMGLAEFLQRNSSKKTIDDNGFRLEPRTFVLGTTKEYIRLHLRPDANGNCLAARVEGKSSLARCGILIHFTAPTIHAGFEGNITLEIINLGAAPFMLHRDMPIAQLIFEEVKGTPSENPSQFQGQTAPEGKVDPSKDSQ